MSDDLGEVLDGASWEASQYLPAHAIATLDEGEGGPGDPKKKKPAAATMPATDRILSGDEWDQAQRKSEPELKAWQVPRVPIVARDATSTAIDRQTEPKGTPLAPFDIHDPTTYANPILRQIVNPAMENPLTTAAVTVAPFATAASLPVATALGVLGQPALEVARYGYQKYLASDLSPDARAEFEADPHRVSGEAAAVQAAMLGLAPLIHVGVKGAGRIRSAMDYGAGMTEAGAQGVGELQFGRFSDQHMDGVARDQFAAQLEQGAATARIPNDVARPAGLVPSREVQPPARQPRAVEGLVVPENAKAGKVTPIATEGAAAPLEERAALDQSVRDYHAERAAQDAQDLSDARRADAERVARIAGGVRRRPGGVAATEDARPFFESEHGAEMLGTMAGRHGMPNDASPYLPGSSLDTAWKDGHQAAAETPAVIPPAAESALPSYPEGFAMGDAEPRIPPDYKPTRPKGFDPTAIPEGATPETVALANALRPSRFRGHSLAQLDEALLDAQTRLETAQRDELVHSEGQMGTQEWQDRVDNNQEAEVYYAKTRAQETQRARNQLAQIEREYALRGVTGDQLAERVQTAQEARLERQAMQEESSLALMMGEDDPFADPAETAPAPEAAPVAAGTGSAPAGSPPSAPLEGTGDVRTRGLAASVERRAIEQRITTTLGDLPEYRQLSMADQADRAADLLARDPALARRVALGLALPPDGLLPESVFKAVESHAIAEGDVATLRELATGRLTTEATEMGRRIRALRGKDPDSAVDAIKSVVDARTGNADVPRATEAVVADLRAKLTKMLSSEDLAKFIDSLRC